MAQVGGVTPVIETNCHWHTCLSNLNRINRRRKSGVRGGMTASSVKRRWNVSGRECAGAGLDFFKGALLRIEGNRRNADRLPASRLRANPTRGRAARLTDHRTDVYTGGGKPGGLLPLLRTQPRYGRRRVTAPRCHSASGTREPPVRLSSDHPRTASAGLGSQSQAGCASDARGRSAGHSQTPFRSQTTESGHDLEVAVNVARRLMPHSHQPTLGVRYYVRAPGPCGRVSSRRHGCVLAQGRRLESGTEAHGGAHGAKECHRIAAARARPIHHSDRGVQYASAAYEGGFGSRYPPEDKGVDSGRPGGLGGSACAGRNRLD